MKAFRRPFTSKKNKPFGVLSLLALTLAFLLGQPIQADNLTSPASSQERSQSQISSVVTETELEQSQLQSSSAQTTEPETTAKSEVTVSTSLETSSFSSSSSTNETSQHSTASTTVTKAKTSAVSTRPTAHNVTDTSPKNNKTLQPKDYLQADATQLASLVRTGQVSSEDLVKLALAAIAQTNGKLNNVITLRADQALAEARQLKDTGQPFLGVPILIKGLGHTIKGGENTDGLSFMAGTKSSSTGRYVKALQNAGFIVIGQTSYPEMGWINVTNSDLYGVTHNPWNLERNPGGSSGGSSAAVAIGQVPIASASDGGGSIRIPASWSGTIGFFPTIGNTAGNSATPYNNVGHFAETKTMRDTENLFNALLMTDIPNSTLSKNQPIAYSRQTPAGTPISSEALEALDQAVSFLKSQGYQLIEVPYPIDGEKLMKAYYTIAAYSASSVNYLANQKLKRNLQLGDTELLTWALYQTSRDLTKQDLKAAYAQIDQIRAQMADFYQTYPIFLTPTNAYPAPSANYHHITANMAQRLRDMSALTKEEKLQLIYDQWLPAWTLTPYTQLANLTQTPAISLPTSLTADGLPMGIMFNTYSKNDRALLALGYLFENAGLFQTFYHHQNLQKPHFNIKPTAIQKSFSSPQLTLSQETSIAADPHLSLMARKDKFKAQGQTDLPKLGQLSTTKAEPQAQVNLPQTASQDDSILLILLGLSSLSLAWTISYKSKDKEAQ